MDVLAALLLLAVTAASSTSPEKDSVSVIKTIRKTSSKETDLYQSDSHRPLWRTKRSWIITTIELEEEDKGPFPKVAGELFNNVEYNASVRYLISGPGVDDTLEPGLFSIQNYANGRVYVHRTIDRERTPFFKIRFNVADRMPRHTENRSLFFIIKIKDINDNSPMFSKEEFNVTIKENHDTDEPVFHVIAVDKDEENTANSQLTYSLITQAPNLKEPRFNINPTSGLIVISGCLDHKMASSFKLLIKVNDHGTPQMSSTAIVNIAVEDMNNHLPVFIKKNYQLQISEGKAERGVLRLQIEDQDSLKTPGWRAKYKIVKGNEKEQFSVETDPETNEGILSVIEPLIYEGASEKQLVISVENEEPFFSCRKGKLRRSPVSPINAFVSVKVLDINEAPEFHIHTLVLEKEDGVKPGTRLETYTAVDPDVVPNKIKYKLVHDPAGWVTIGENSGVITAVKELDRESPYMNKGVYLIIVHAIDDGIPPQTGTGTVLLYLSDINDHVPTLVTSSLEVCDKEGWMPLIIKAEDNDSHPFAGPFTFKFADDSERIKKNWKLTKSFGDSAELIMSRSLPHGSYLVPLLITDRQGGFKKQNLTVRLCHCPEGHTCVEPISTASTLGAAAIAPILAALLLLLVVGCLVVWYSCRAKTMKSQVNLPYEEGNQTLISYNEESENYLSKATPDVLYYAVQLPTNAEIRREKQMFEGTSGMVQYRPGSYNHGSYRAQYVETLQRQPLSMTEGTVGEMLIPKLYHLSNLEENMPTYEPHRIYAEEGKLDRNSSILSATY